MSASLFYMHRSFGDMISGNSGYIFKKIPACTIPMLIDLMLLNAWIWTVFFSVRHNKGRDTTKGMNQPPTALWTLAISCAVAEWSVA